MTEHEAIDESETHVERNENQSSKTMGGLEKVCALDDDGDKWMDTADQAPT